MVPAELLVTAMVGGYAVVLTAVLATVKVLGDRIADLRADMNDRFIGIDSRLQNVQDELVTVRVSLGALDARLTTLEQR